MGDPKFQRKKYRRPKMPWRADVLAAELELMGKYGLRNKRELWKAQGELSRIRRQARLLLAADPETRAERERVLLASLVKRGLISPGAKIDDILSLKVDDLLERRLQTVVWRKGLASTPHQARQYIVHGHITVGGRVVRTPGYLVGREEERTVGLRETSPLLKQVAASG
jgi:small subunit ribosomal protein S4